jgi:hypothetical protein
MDQFGLVQSVDRLGQGVVITVSFACKGSLFCAPRDALHNSLRTVAARARAVYGVVFLANSSAIGCKKRLVAHPDPRYPSLARVMQSIPSVVS